MSRKVGAVVCWCEHLLREPWPRRQEAHPSQRCSCDSEGVRRPGEGRVLTTGVGGQVDSVGAHVLRSPEAASPQL